MAKKRGKDVLKIFGIILLILVLSAGSYFISKSKVFETAITPPSVQIIASPVFGSIDCLPTPGKITETSGEFVIQKEGVVLRAGQINDPISSYSDNEVSTNFISVFASTPDLKPTVIIRKANVPSAFILFDEKAIRYIITNLDGSNPQKERIVLSKDDIRKIRDGVNFIKELPLITNKQKIFLKYEDFKSGSLGCLNPFNEKYRDECWQDYDGTQPSYNVVYHPYSLVVEDIFNPKRAISSNCLDPLDESSDIKTGRAMLGKIAQVIKSGSADYESGGKAYSVGGLYPGEFIPYISGFVLSPYPKETYNGKNAYCIANTGGGATMYEFSTLSTIDANGNSYSYLVADQTKPIGQEECCNGAPRLNQICENHKWVSRGGEECSLINPCKISDYVIDVSDPNRKTVYKEECIEGKCQIKTKDVDCASSYACSEGYACKDFKCGKTGASIGTTPSGTGNKLDCESSGGTWYTEKSEVCEGIICIAGITKPKVTETSFCKPKFNPILYLPYFIGILIFVIIIVYLTRNKRRKR